MAVLTRLEERLEEADHALASLGHFGAALSRATAFGAQRQELMRRLRLWLRAAHELSYHARPLQPQQPSVSRLPPPTPLDVRVFEVPRHQLWRHRQLVASLLGSIESLLDALAVRVPAAAALVRRFEVWEALPPNVTQSHEYDLRVPDAEQSRRELHEHDMQDSQFESRLRAHARTLPPLHAAASGSPDGTDMARVAAKSGIVDVCLAAVASGLGALGRLFQH